MLRDNPGSRKGRDIVALLRAGISTMLTVGRREGANSGSLPRSIDRASFGHNARWYIGGC